MKMTQYAYCIEKESLGGVLSLIKGTLVCCKGGREGGREVGRWGREGSHQMPNVTSVQQTSFYMLPQIPTQPSVFTLYTNIAGLTAGIIYGTVLIREYAIAVLHTRMSFTSVDPLPNTPFIDTVPIIQVRPGMVFSMATNSGKLGLFVAPTRVSNTETLLPTSFAIMHTQLFSYSQLVVAEQVQQTWQLPDPNQLR